MKKIMLRTVGLYLNTVSVISPRKGGELGFRLFCEPFRTKIKGYQLDFLQSAEQFSFVFDGLKIQTYKWGNGPRKVLFIHGWQSHSFRWKKYVESLPKDQFTVYALDAPGHGLSEGNSITVPYYGELIQSFVRRFGGFETAIAHSLGGMSLLYALSHYDGLSIEKAAVMAVPGRAIDFMQHYQQTLNLNAKTMTSIINHFEFFISQPIDYFETEKFVRRIEIPGLIIHDLNDNDAPYAHAQRLHGAWKSSELVTTQGLGHNLRSKEVVEKIKVYIESN